MKMHLKRQKVPKTWPIPRKGTAFVVRFNSKGIPVLVVLRDILNLAQNRREVKKALNQKHVLLNGKPVIDEKKSLELLDILNIVPSKKNYRLGLSQYGKYELTEVSEKDASKKNSKVIGKKILKSKKVQLNLGDGRNYISDLKCKVNDSVIVNLQKNKLEKVLPLKDKSNILVIGGKHSGYKGEISKIFPELKMAEIKSGENKFNVLIKQLMVTE
ncbi:hypothetical protein HOD29_03170 [archaeon]|jgi:small subunit ribosomal protein S4e|nr:hypothetical protein [archaeon]